MYQNCRLLKYTFKLWHLIFLGTSVTHAWHQVHQISQFSYRQSVFGWSCIHGYICKKKRNGWIFSLNICNYFQVKCSLVTLQWPPCVCELAPDSSVYTQVHMCTEHGAALESRWLQRVGTGPCERSVLGLVTSAGPQSRGWGWQCTVYRLWSIEAVKDWTVNSMDHIGCDLLRQ